MKTKTERTWRRINPYFCLNCGKKRYSFKFNRAKERICTKCGQKVENENQKTLFES